ncbi:MAG: hypothetical protein QGH20_07085, partial [Candidatus Latescibacteria bacterium]|nr:hypothetical protein [Candidatus Latescibacterota bacterium]
MLASLTIPAQASGQLRQHYIYRPHNNFGIDAQFSPVIAFINGSCDYVRSGYGEGSLFDRHYLNGMKNVNRILLNTQQIVRSYNQQEDRYFVGDQIVPTHLSNDHSPWVPNYQSY